MSNPSYSPSFDETGPFTAPTGDDVNARTSAAAADPNVEPTLTDESDDDTLLTSDPSEDGWGDAADEIDLTVQDDLTGEDGLADEALIEGDELDDDDDLEDFDDLDDDDDDDDDDDLEDDLDEDDDELEDEEFAEASRVENDIAADTRELDDELDDDDDDDDDDNGFPRSLSDTQPL